MEEEQLSRPFGVEDQDHYSSFNLEQITFYNSEIVSAADEEQNHIQAADSDSGRAHDFQSEPPNSISTSPSLSLMRENDLLYCNSLYLAALTGDWKKAESLIHIHPFAALDMALTDRRDTALHIAAAAQHTSFVEKLVKRMMPIQLLVRNTYGYRAICFAAISGSLRIAKVMVEKQSMLPDTSGYNRSIPLCLAVTHKRIDMAYYLLPVTNLNGLPTKEKVQLLHATIISDYYDIGLKILEVDPELALERNEDNQTALHALSRKPDAIGSRSQLRIWQKYTNFLWFKGSYTKALMKTLAHQMVKSMGKIVLQRFQQSEELLDFIATPSRFLHDAAKVGNVEFLIVLIGLYPDLIWNLDDDYRSIFHVAVENRQESVFGLIYEIGGFKDIIVNFVGKNNVNIQHLAASQAAPNHLNRVSGPALQMQRELQWFEEVEKISAPSFSLRTNTSSKPSPIEVGQEADCLTMHEIFAEKHKQLQKDGEMWMKSTSNSCMLVATLIATVVFAAAFTVPGGNNQNTGAPMFRNKDLFSVFVIADAAALISSSISIMMFLSILTSRFAIEDFLNSLPWRLLIGLATLFISIACMVVAFSATFFMFYDKVRAWVPWVVAAMAVAPVTCFTFLQYKLWADTFRATVWSKYIFKPPRHRPLDLHQSLIKKHPTFSGQNLDFTKHESADELEFSFNSGVKLNSYVYSPSSSFSGDHHLPRVK